MGCLVLMNNNNLNISKLHVSLLKMCWDEYLLLYCQCLFLMFLFIDSTIK